MTSPNMQMRKLTPITEQVELRLQDVRDAMKSS